MRLTMFSDYAIRVLIYAAAAGERLVTIEEIATAYDVSRSHLMKVVNSLTKSGYLKGVRGRAGGVTLAMPKEEINLGAVVRATEPDFALVECFTPGNQCIISGCCRLPNILNEALGAFAATLGRYTLADLSLNPADFSAGRRPPSAPRGPEFTPKPTPAGRRRAGSG